MAVSIVKRNSVRVAVVDDEGCVLLLRAVLPYDEWWELPGGGIELGEALEEAALRELAEETGIRVNRLDRDLGTVDTEFLWEGRRYLQRESVFLVSVHGTVEIELPALPPAPAAQLVEWRWWSRADLAATNEQIHPPQLVDLLGRGEPG